MKKKEIIDLITNIALLILASCILLLPTFKVDNLKVVLIIIFSFYTIFKLTQFILTFKAKDYESLFTSLISICSLISLFFINISTKNIVLLLMIWFGLMCLIKLKKADFYHDRKNKMWIIRLFMLFIFLTNGLLTGLNLTLDSSFQIIVIGNFFFVNSLLDSIDPIVVYLMGVRK